MALTPFSRAMEMFEISSSMRRVDDLVIEVACLNPTQKMRDERGKARCLPNSSAADAI